MDYETEYYTLEVESNDEFTEHEFSYDMVIGE